MVNSGSDDADVGSDLENTSFDSDQIEEFDSEEEFSRIIPTPSTKKQVARNEEPESSPKAHVLKERTILEFFKPAKDVPNIQQTQHTQQLPPLSGTQLREMMSDDNNDELKTSYDKRSAKSSRSFELASARNTIGDETDRRVDEDEPINTDGFGSELEEERILSSDDEGPSKNDGSDNIDDASGSNIAQDVTPVEHDVLSGTIESQRRLALEHNRLKEVEYVDETPLKLLSMPTPPSPYVCVIVKWKNDPNWWPARAEKSAWEKRKKRALVLFRLNETGLVDLSTAAGEFELMKGAKVHLIRHGKRGVEYTVVEAKQCPEYPKVLITKDGCNRVVLESQKSAKITKSRWQSVARSVEAELSDLYFTNQDIEVWKALRNRELPCAVPSTPKRVNSSRDLGLYQLEEELCGGIFSKEGEFPNTSTPRKRFRSEGSPRSRSNVSLRDAIEEATTTPYTPRSHSRRSLQPSPSKASFNTDNTIRPASPQFSPSKLSVLRAFPMRASPEKLQASPTLFSNAIFAVSLCLSNRNNSRLVARLPDLISKHGGEVLEEGLSQKVKLSEMSEEEGCMPDLKHDFGDATLCAVIADAPRRTLKYLEMLALGWPCLHYQYLLDCVRHNELLDWQSYLLPAGELNLANRRMTASLNTQAFHRRWLQGANLNEQFRKRRIVLKSMAPICVLQSNPALEDQKKWLLVTMSGPLYRVWFYKKLNSIPEGSLALELDSPSEPHQHIDTDPELLFQIKTQAAADVMLHKGLEWLVQCLINGELV